MLRGILDKFHSVKLMSAICHILLTMREIKVVGRGREKATERSSRSQYKSLLGEVWITVFSWHAWDRSFCAILMATVTAKLERYLVPFDDVSILLRISNLKHTLVLFNPSRAYRTDCTVQRLLVMCNTTNISSYRMEPWCEQEQKRLNLCALSWRRIFNVKHVWIVHSVILTS